MKIRVSTSSSLMLPQYLSLRLLFDARIRFFRFNIDFYDVAVFTISIKGNPKLQHNGFAYVKSKKLSNGNQMWRCEKNRRYGCRGRACSKKFGQVEMVQVTAQHNHPSNHIN